MNILEFAQEAGVSTATVSRAFHEPDKLRPETRDHILALAQEKGYYPSPSGRALKRGRHDVLGVVWPLEVEGAEAEFAQRILAALTRHLVAHDLDLLVCPVNRREPATITHARRTLQRSRCDAWILLYPRAGDELVEALAQSQKPVVCLMGALPEHPDWKSVRLDQRGWMEDALRRLKAAGCRRPVFFGPRENEPDHALRLAAFLELAPRSGPKTPAVWVPDATALRHLLTAGEADAILGADDQAALTALDLCRELQLPVPRKIKVAGIDDSTRASFVRPTLSSYRQPLDEMAGCAVELALGSRRRSRLFTATFIPRESLPG